MICKYFISISLPNNKSDFVDFWTVQSGFLSLCESFVKLLELEITVTEDKISQSILLTLWNQQPHSYTCSHAGLYKYWTTIYPLRGQIQA